MSEDIETDADQSHAGIGSYQPENVDSLAATCKSGPSTITVESIVGDLRYLEQQHLVEKATMQKTIDDLTIRLKTLLNELDKTTEEKDIWLEKCQRMESMMTMSTEAVDESHSVADEQNGIKNLEILLQENAFLKTETESLKKQMETMSRIGVATTSYQDVKSSIQPTEDDPLQPDQHEKTHATLTSQISQQESTDGVSEGALQQTGHSVGIGRHTSLNERRERGVRGLSLDEAGYPTEGMPDDMGAAGGAGQVYSSEPDSGDISPDSSMLQFLAKTLQHSEYKPVLRHAGYEDRYFADIEYRNQRDAQECRYESLRDWQQKMGYRLATVRVIVYAMLKAELRERAQDFCREFSLDFLIEEYEYQQGYDQEDDDDSTFPTTPLTSGDAMEDIPPAVPEREQGPLEKMIGPLMQDPSSFEEEFMRLVDDCYFVQEQLDSFMKDQRWDGAKKMTFQQELGLLGDGVTLSNVLTAWALTVGSILDSNPNYNIIDKRKHVWKMMQSLRKSHNGVYKSLKEDKIFPGGVLGVNPKTGKRLINQLNFQQHNDMKLKLQLERDDGKDWRGVAAQIPVTQQIINNWKQKGHAIATDDTLKTFGTSGKGTVQKLYEVFVEMDRGDVAEILEVDDK